MTGRARARRAVALAIILSMALVPAAAARSKNGSKGGSRTSDDERTRLAEQAPAPKPLAVVGGDIYPITSDPVPGGTLLLRDGRIERVLTSSNGRDHEADGYEVIDARGRRVYPGLVSPGADSVGLAWDVDAGGRKQLLTGRLSDSFDVHHANVEHAAAAGITTALVYRFGGSAQDAFAGRGALLKMSFGEPRGFELSQQAAVMAGPGLVTAAGRHRLRSMIDAAKKWKSLPRAKRKPNPMAELTLRLIDGEVPVVAFIQTADRIATLLDIQREFGIRVILLQPHEAWVLADQLAAADVAVLQHVRTSWWKPRGDRRREVAGGWRFDAPTVLRDAGVTVAVVPYQDAVVTWGVAGRDLTTFAMEAAFAQRGGLTPQEALESITIVPARIFGVDDRVGSIETGKDADVIITDGDVLDYRTFVRTAIVNGRVVYRAEGNRAWGWVIERRMRALGESPAEATPAESATPQRLQTRDATVADGAAAGR